MKETMCHKDGTRCGDRSKCRRAHLMMPDAINERERILCAAIYVDTGEADPPRRTYSYPRTGIVFCGWRHCDCFVPLTAWAQRLTTEERARIGEEHLAGRHQGFLTSRGRYVDREEAMVIARAAKQTDADKSGLMSEDLY